MSLEAMLAALTPQEKLDAMNILWRDLSTNPAGVPSPDWHGDVLADRIKPDDKHVWNGGSVPSSSTMSLQVDCDPPF